MKLKSGRQQLKLITEYVSICMILHNLLIGYNDFENDDNTYDDTSDIDAANELNQLVPSTAATDTQQTQLKNYLLEKNCI